jgi:hypothetical protein
MIHAEVYDYDGATSDHIGSAQVDLGQIVGKRTVILDLKSRQGNKKTGTIILRAEQAND